MIRHNLQRDPSRERDCEPGHPYFAAWSRLQSAMPQHDADQAIARGDFSFRCPPGREYPIAVSSPAHSNAFWFVSSRALRKLAGPSRRRVSGASARLDYRRRRRSTQRSITLSSSRAPDSRTETFAETRKRLADAFGLPALSYSAQPASPAPGHAQRRRRYRDGRTVRTDSDVRRLLTAGRDRTRSTSSECMACNGLRREITRRSSICFCRPGRFRPRDGIARQRSRGGRLRGWQRFTVTWRFYVSWSPRSLIRPSWNWTSF